MKDSTLKVDPVNSILLNLDDSGVFGRISSMNESQSSASKVPGIAVSLKDVASSFDSVLVSFCIINHWLCRVCTDDKSSPSLSPAAKHLRQTAEESCAMKASSLSRCLRLHLLLLHHLHLLFHPRVKFWCLTGGNMDEDEDVCGEDVVMIDDKLVSVIHCCPVIDCGATFSKKKQLQRHERTHSLEKPFVCEHDGCSKSFGTKAHFKRHLKTHDFDTNGMFRKRKQYVCSFCGQETKSKFDLKIHEATHTGDKPLKCDLCDASFTLPGRLKRHLKLTHKTHDCSHDACDFTTNKWSLFRKHMSQHKKSCQFCSKSFSSMEALASHETKHSVKLQCPHCESQYSRPSNLKTHIRTAHDKVFFKCSVEGCDREFAHRCTLRNHLRKHKRDKASDDASHLSTAGEDKVKEKDTLYRRRVVYAELMSGFQAPKTVCIEIMEEDKNFRRELASENVTA